MDVNGFQYLVKQAVRSENPEMSDYRFYTVKTVSVEHMAIQFSKHRSWKDLSN